MGLYSYAVNAYVYNLGVVWVCLYILVSYYVHSYGLCCFFFFPSLIPLVLRSRLVLYMYIYMCVCVCICMCMYIYVYVYIYICICEYVYIYIYVVFVIL